MKKLYKHLLTILLLIFLTTTIGFAQVSVTATAGTAGPTPYTTLKAAFDAINAGTHQGVIAISITANTTETAPCVLNSSGAGGAVYTFVSVRPVADAVTISGATATGRGLIELNGADNITIDGDNAGSPGINRDLTIQNTAVSTVTFTMVVRIAVATTVVTSANNNTIQNCTVSGSATGRNVSTATSNSGSENASYGIYCGGGASTVSQTNAPSAITSLTTTAGSGATMNNLVISNNSVNACARGIAVQASNINVINTLTVSNNTVGASTPGNSTTVYSKGITLQGFTAATVSGNTIQNIESFLGTTIYGIDLGSISATGTAAVIEKNVVNGMNNRNTNTFGAYGINIQAGNGQTVRNNMIQGITGDMTGGAAFSTDFGLFGIIIRAGLNHLVYYNSVNMYGARSGTPNSSLLSAAFGIIGTGLTGCDVRNNIFANTQSGGTTSLAYVSIYLPSGGTSAMNLILNNNAYYSGPTAASQGIAQRGTTAGTGFYLASNFIPGAAAPATNLRAYTSTLSASGTNDNLSFATTDAAPYTTSTDLHIPASTTTPVESGGVIIAGATTDIDGENRYPNSPYPDNPASPAIAPDMGADEFAGTSTNTSPILIVSQSILNFGSVINGATSAEMTYTVTGNFLTGTAVSVTAPANFAVSLTTGGPYLSSIPLTYTAPTLAAKTIFVVFQPTAANTTYSGNIANAGGGAATVNVAVSGSSPCDPFIGAITENFESATFPPACWAIANTTTGTTSGPLLWFNTASSFGVGSACVKANFFNYNAGNNLDLITPPLDLSGIADPYLVFDHAYATYDAEADYLEIWTSSNGGGSYTLLQTIPGGSAGPLNTGGATHSAFVPTSAQWASKAYALPSGTNKVRFRCVSAFGNNLYLDMIKIQNGPPVFPPTPPINPNPADVAVNIAIDGSLTWTFGANTATYDLMFGPTGSMALVVSGAASGTTGSFAYSGLSYNSNYQWQVIEHNGALVTNGPVWSFQTQLPPTYDVCAGAITVNCNDIITGTTVGATIDNVITCAGTPSSPGVWYKFVGTGDMVSASTCTGTTYDSRICVFEGTCGSLVCIHDNDDYCGYQSRVDWFGAAGTTYYILIYGFNTNTGAFTLTMDCSSPATATWLGLSTYWNAAANWDVNDVPGVNTNVIIPAGKANYPTLVDKGTCNNISIASGASLVDQGTGNLIIGGTATVDLNYTPGQWHLISAPVSGETANMFLGLYLQKHTESTNLYSDIITPATPLNVMQGYAIFNASSSPAHFIGTLNTGNMGSVNNLTRSGSGTNNGWNLTGNPYPSAIDWDASSGWTKTNINNATYILANGSTWATYIAGTGVNGGTRYIAPGQGFFVAVAEGNTTGTLNMSNAVRVSNSTPFFKETVANLVRLGITGNGYTDETAVRFLDGASATFDNDLDAYKLFGDVAEAAQIYSLSSDLVRLAINTQPQTVIVPVGLKCGQAGTYTIAATEINNQPIVLLEDTEENTVTDLTKNVYTFNSAIGQDEGRFILHFAPLAIPENSADHINIYSSNKDVYISIPANKQGNVKIFNMLGQEITKTRIVDLLTKLYIDQAGVYMVQVTIDGKSYTQKVIIK